MLQIIQKLLAHHVLLSGRLDDLRGDDVEPQLRPDPGIPERDVEQLSRLFARCSGGGGNPHVLGECAADIDDCVVLLWRFCESPLHRL